MRFLFAFEQTVPGVVEMIKVITRKKSERIAKFAFDYATMQGRKKVTAIHKANIMYVFQFFTCCFSMYTKFQRYHLILFCRKMADGLFLNTCEEVSKLYPKIQFQGMIVDNACMQVCLLFYKAYLPHFLLLIFYLFIDGFQSSTV
jgi:isocitrate dehydrogenase (NAD+)